MASNSYWKGTCEPFCDVDVSSLAEWLERTLLNPETRTASHPSFEDCINRHQMVTNLTWDGDFGERTQPLVDEIMAGHFPGCRTLQHMLSFLMIGQHINLHADQQALDWIVRVHVPITTNEHAVYCNPPVEHRMQVGKAYLINTKEPHECWNHGQTHRIHFMFDVLGPYGYGVS